MLKSPRCSDLLTQHVWVTVGREAIETVMTWGGEKTFCKRNYLQRLFKYVQTNST